MGKTYRDSTAAARKCMRNPKGHKSALVNETRKGAVPPSNWEDIPLNSECVAPWNIAYKMFDDDKTDEQIIKTLVKRFKMKHSDANYIVLRIKKRASMKRITGLPKLLGDLFPENGEKS